MKDQFESWWWWWCRQMLKCNQHQLPLCSQLSCGDKKERGHHSIPPPSPSHPHPLGQQPTPPHPLSNRGLLLQNMTTLKEKSFTRQHHGCPRGMGVHYIGQVRKEVLCITIIITKITTNTSAIFITKIILNVIVGLYGVGQVRKEVLRGGKSGSDLGRHPCAGLGNLTLHYIALCYITVHYTLHYVFFIVIFSSFCTLQLCIV